MSVWLAACVLMTPATGQPKFPEPTNLVQLAGSCSLDEPAMAQLREHGLVTFPMSPECHLQGLYYNLGSSGTPVYITSDAMLYLWYEAHREAMKAAERSVLYPELKRLVAGLLDETERLRDAQASESLRQNAVMLAVSRSLLDPEWSPPEDLRADVEAEVQRVMEHSLLQPYPGDDYTQYKVRGHYADDPALSRYFRGAKYLSRQYLTIVDPARTAETADGTRRAAILALALRDGEGLLDLYRQTYDLRAELAGPADTVRLDQTLDACDRVWGEGWGRETIEDVAPLQAELSTDAYPVTRITNRALQPGEAFPARNVAVLGAHYLPDSGLFQQTIDPVVPGRKLPTGLEVAAALGSESALEKLGVLVGDMPQVADTARDFRAELQSSGVYGDWMATLATLFERPEGLPEFAKGDAYAEKQINGCLTSWAHARHNYILYGAQPYSTMGSMSGGLRGLVEPLPEFWARYAESCRRLAALLEARGAAQHVRDVLEALAGKADTFGKCAGDQLAGRDISWAAGEIAGFGSWMHAVFFDSPLVVADVATDPAAGQILHVASGPFRKIVVTVEHEGEWVGAVGYVGSYYEFSEPGMNRLTDAEWKERLERPYGAPEQPAWLALMRTPRSVEQVRAEAALAALNETIRDGTIEEGEAALEAFIAEHTGTEQAPAAIRLLAERHYSGEAYGRCMETGERARPMYGCDARDAALGVAERARRRLEPNPYRSRMAEREQRFVVELEATGPTEGLTTEEDAARQDRRAATLLEMAGVVVEVDDMGFDPSKPEPLERLVEECPDSKWVGTAELARAVLRFQGSPHDPPRRAISDEALEAGRTELLAIAGKYSAGSVGQAARVAAASLLKPGGRHQECFDEVKGLMGWTPSDPDPHPMPGGLRRSHGMLSFSVRSLARDALVWVGVEACAAEDLALVNELLAFAEEHGMGDEEPLGVEVGPVIEYLADEPEGIAAYLACQAMLDHRHGTPPSRDAMVRQAEALAGRFPGTKTAALGLLLAARISRRDDASRERLHSRLAAECPDSTENLLVEVSRLTADREFEKAQPYWDELLERHGNDEGRLKLPEPLRDAADSYDLMAPTEAKRGLDERVAANREQWGPWLVDAGITDDELRSMDWRGVPAAIRERLPERELEFLLSLDGDALRGQAYRIDPIIERHPGDPRIYEILWRLGQEDHLVRIVAAGPETPHFAEAVDQLDTWTPPRREVVRAVLARAHAMAREHAGTPAEVVGLSRAVKALLQRERPERAMEVLEESLAAIEGTRPLRERLVGLRPAIERQLVEKHRGPRLRQLWEVNLEGERVPRNLDTRHTRPVTADGRVYVPTYTESGAPAVVCVDCDSGERVWIRETGHGPLTVEVVGNRVCVSAGAVIDGLDAQTGELVWRNGPGISAKGRIWCGASGDAICAYWDQGLLFAINAETGETLWEKDGVLQEQAPSVSEGLVLTVTKDFDVIARSTETGDELWRAEWEDAGSTDNTPRSRAAMQAGILAGGQPALLVGWSREVAILVLEPATGDVTLRKELRGPAASQTRLVSCKSDVVVVADNEALGLSPVDGRTRWIVPELAQGALAIQATDRICLVFDGSELTVVDAKIGGAMGQHRLERGYTVPATEVEGDEVRLYIAHGGVVTAWALDVSE